MVELREGAPVAAQRRRLKRWQRWALVAGAAPAAAAVLASTQALAPAAAFEGPGFNGPNGHQQFVLIDSDLAPMWKAEMWLYEGDREVYHWKTGWESGGKATWWYTSGDTGRIHLIVKPAAVVLNHKTLDTWIEPTAAAGHCVKVASNGYINGWNGAGWDEWADPSMQPSTEGCTPD